MSYLNDLNSQQNEAVTHKEGPLLILAGAGAGKTKTLTYRILHLIQQGVEPQKILAITFTNKAAQEMRERVNHLLEKYKTQIKKTTATTETVEKILPKIDNTPSQPIVDIEYDDNEIDSINAQFDHFSHALGNDGDEHTASFDGMNIESIANNISSYPAKSEYGGYGRQYKDIQNNSPFVSTFHVFGATLVREYAHKVGVTKNFTIFDRNDSKQAIKQAMEEVRINPKEFEPARVLSMISREKGNGVTVEYFTENKSREFIGSVIGKIWVAYEKILKKENSLDFDDLLLKASQLLRDEEVKNALAHRYEYIHIDEYQDTNRVQYNIAQALAVKHRNITVVGDIDQTIYTWRGADISNILNFERDYPEARVILLEQNYRSTQTILSAANTVIEKNKNRRKKTLFTENHAGDKISIYGAYDEYDEAQFIALKSKELIQSGISPNDIAVLYRANFQSRTLEEAFLSHNVDHFVLGTRFYDRKEVKDILSYIRAALNPESITDIKRVINVPARGIGKVTMLKILSQKRQGLDGATLTKAQPFFAIIDDIRVKSTHMLPGELVGFALRRSGILGEIEKGKTEEDTDRVENLKELVSLGARYDDMGPEGIHKFLEDTSLLSDQDSLEEKKNGVRLMTVHASKGLEFNYVFITGLEDGLFPQQKDADEASAQTERAEEERRLFYVALTRARKKLFLSYSAVRTVFGKTEVKVPSTFLADIHDSLVMYEESKNPHGPFGSPRRKERIIYFD